MPKQTKKRAVKGARFVGYRVVKGASLPSATTITRRYHAAHDLYDSSNSEDTDEESFLLQSKRTFAKQPPPQQQGVVVDPNKTNTNKGETAATTITATPAAAVDAATTSKEIVASSSSSTGLGLARSSLSTNGSSTTATTAGESSSSFAATPATATTVESVAYDLNNDERTVAARRRCSFNFLNRNSDGATNNTTAPKNNAATVERKNGQDDGGGKVASSTSNKCRSATEAEENLQRLPLSESKGSGWWTEAEHNLLLRGIDVYGLNNNYLCLAASLPGRTERDVEAYIERHKLHDRKRSTTIRLTKEEQERKIIYAQSQKKPQQYWLKLWEYLQLRLGWTLDYASQNDCLKHGSSFIFLRNGFMKYQPGTLGVDHFFTEDDVTEYCTKNGIHIPALNSSTVLMESINTKNDDDGLRQNSDDCSPPASLANTRNSNNNPAPNSNKRRKNMTSNGTVLNEGSRKKMRKVSQGTHRTKASTPCTTQTKPTVSAMLMCHDENLKWKVGRDETPPWVVKQPRIDHVICLKGSAVTYSGGYYYLPGEGRKRFTSKFSNLGELAKHFARTNAYLLSSSGSLESENNHERSLKRFVQYAMVPGKQSMWESIRGINRSETSYLLCKLGYRRTHGDCWEPPDSFVQAKILNPKYDSLELLCDALRGIDDIYVPQIGDTTKRCKLPVTQIQIMALRLRIAEGFTEFDKDYSDGDSANEDDSITDLDWADIRNSIATQIDDEMNSGKIVATTKRAMHFDTKYPKGVSNSRSRKNPYAAVIMWRGKNRHIGCWDTLECAARAYMLAKVILRPSEQEEKKNANLPTSSASSSARSVPSSPAPPAAVDDRRTKRQRSILSDGGNRWSILWKYLSLTLGWTYEYASLKDINDFGASTIWLRKGFTKKQRGKLGQDHFFTENDVITYCEKKTIYPPGSRSDRQDEGEVDNGDDNNYHKASVVRKKNKTKEKKSTSTRNHINRYSIGTQIRKSFSGRWYTGEVINYNKKRQLYLVEYGDGDTEELDAADMEKWSSKQQQHSIVTKAATPLSFANRICRVEEAMLGATTINDNITNGCGGGYIHRIHNLELQIFAPDYQVPADLVRRLEALEQFL